MDRASELANALRALAINADDQDLADALLEAVAKVERFADYKLRNQTQGVLGETQNTLQERLDSLFNVARDTHQLVFSVQQEQHQQGGLLQQQGAELSAARAEFHDGLAAIGERVSHNEARLDEHDAAIADFRQSRQRSMDRHDATQAQLQDISAQVERLSAEIAQVLSFGFIDAVFDAVIAVELDGTIVQVNDQAELLFGCHRTELIGRPIESLIPEPVRGAHSTQRTDYATDPQPRRMGRGGRVFPALRCDGTQVQVEVGLKPFTFGGRTCIIATIREAGDG